MKRSAVVVGFIICTACVCVTVFGSADDAKPQLSEVEFRKLVATAEVHGVGVYKPAKSHVELADVADWTKLAEDLQSQAGPNSRIRSLLREETEDRLANKKLVAKLSEPRGRSEEVALLRSNLVSDLSKALGRVDLYDESAFKNAPLSKSARTVAELGEKRTALDTEILNRYLLSIALPNGLQPPPPHFRKVRVRLMPGADTVLVLSSYELCRWEVEVEKDAKLVGVVLCGYHYQELRGVKVPVLSRFRNGPDDKKVVRLQSLEGWDQKRLEFRDFEKGIKELVGKDMNSFQGENEPKEEPVVVRPGKKK